MAQTSIYMSHTKKTVRQTVTDLQDLLGASGLVDAVQLTYDSGQPVGVKFSMTSDGRSLYFELPVRWWAVQSMLRREGSSLASDEAKCRRVAWRQVYRWLQAQLAIVAAGQVDASEVMLPYLLVPGEDGDGQRTLYESMRDAGRLLPAGQE